MPNAIWWISNSKYKQLIWTDSPELNHTFGNSKLGLFKNLKKF